MATISFKPGVDLDHLPPTQVIHWINRDSLMVRFARMQAEWEELAALEGKTLAEMKASVGLMLNDFAFIIEEG